MKSRVDEYLTVAMAIHSVVHMREEWIAGVVPERVYTCDVGITVLRNALVLSLLRMKTPAFFLAITGARLVTVGPGCSWRWTLCTAHCQVREASRARGV